MHIVTNFRCFICSLTSKQFNDLEKAKSAEIIDFDRLDFGLSPLHARIRFLDLVLHVAYKSDVQEWQVHSPENKEIVAKKKKSIQAKFKAAMGLNIDKPKNGFGSTNDGSTARKVMRNPEETAKITGLANFEEI